ncbi:hypothetical protein VTK73DRAFT_1307 [Phialemonium thermophilum]|uniref:Uncharacterized protein n=1 Tax=Phialemonium thermophilum TaxID=223376 RepID=A0ABR3VTM6_9PEZI
MEDLCAEWGLEFVHAPLGAAAAAGEGVRNEFGEKVGIPRVREALESNNWSQATGFGDDDDDDDDPDGVDVEDAAPAARRDVSGPTSGRSQDDEDKDEDGADFDPETLDFGFDREDFAGLRQAIWSAGREGEEGDDGGEGQEKVLGEEDVEKLEGMMRKLLAVRDMSAGLPEEQRRRMARQAVGEVMKEL